MNLTYRKCVNTKSLGGLKYEGHCIIYISCKIDLHAEIVQNGKVQEKFCCL